MKRGHLICAALVLVGCDFDWARYDPRASPLPGEAMGGGGSGGDTTSSMGGAPNTSSTSAGGGGIGGLGGGAMAVGGAGGVAGGGGSGGAGGAGGGGGGSGGSGGAPPLMCSGQVVEQLDNGIAVTGSTVGAPAMLDANCASAAGGERIYAFVLGSTADVMVSTDLPGTTFDVIPYVREDCEDSATEVGCNDDGTGDVIVLTALPAGTYFVILDSHSPSNEGDFELRVDW